MSNLVQRGEEIFETGRANPGEHWEAIDSWVQEACAVLLEEQPGEEGLNRSELYQTYCQMISLNLSEEGEED